MDWKNNQWVGIGAAAALVLAIVGIFMFMGRDSTNAKIGDVVYTFKCKNTGQTFTHSLDEIDNMSMEDYAKYKRPYADGAYCDIDQQEDAQRVFFCPVCNEWYPFQRQDETAADGVTCPKGHFVPF